MAAEDDYLIWWTDGNDCAAIGPNPELPEGIAGAYMSRYGRAGRGRLWQSDAGGHAVSVDDWPDTPLGAVLGSRYGGVVIRREDLPHVAQLPGVVTDTRLVRVS